MSEQSADAPEGMIFVCMACGKMSRNRYGEGVRNGWDVSCAINCHLLPFDRLELNDRGTRVVGIKPEPTKPTP